MNEKQVYRQDEQIIFRGKNQKNRVTFNKGIVGATAIFGSLSMVMSVVPVHTFAAENPTKDLSTSTVQQQQVETVSAPVQGEINAIVDPTPSDKDSAETTSSNEEKQEDTTPSDKDQGKQEGTTPSDKDQGKQEGTTPSDKDQGKQEGTTPSDKDQGKQEEGTTPSEPNQPVVTPVENQSASSTGTDTIERVDFSDQWSSVLPIVNEPTPSGVVHYVQNPTTEAFIKQIGESARKVGKEKDLYASVMIAQAILESGSGSSSLSQAPHYNLFGIKGEYKGQSVSFNTQEDDGTGQLSTTSANFRSYESYEDSFNDYAELMTKGISGDSQFYEGTWKSRTTSYEDTTAFLTGKYATDTQYDQKLNGLIETYDLTQYDREAESNESVSSTISAKGYAVPVANYVLSSRFGTRSGEFHRGLDLAAASGEAVMATKAGKVITAETHPSWGNYVVVLHEDGTTTLYAHLSEIKATVNQEVAQGQVIGLVGSTGNSTGPHLHFEICSDASLLQSKLVDPETILFG